MVTLTKIYSEKKQYEEDKLQNINFEEIRVPGSGVMLNLVFKEINRLRNIQGLMTTGQDLFQLNFHLA